MSDAAIRPNVRRRCEGLGVVAAALVVAATVANPLGAQFAYPTDSARDRCLASLPPTALRRVNVFVVPTIADRNQRRAVPQVALGHEFRCTRYVWQGAGP